MTAKLEEKVLLDLGFVKLDSINNEITYYYINNNNDPNANANENDFINLERLCLLISFVNSKNE